MMAEMHRAWLGLGLSVRMSLMRALACASLLMSGFAAPIGATETAQPLAENPAVEKRLVAIAEDLRCLVCQNESLASSRADLANDLRREVRELIVSGKTDTEIKDYLVARYGDFVLYRPPVKGTTAFLWFGPFALLALAVGVLIWVLRRRTRTRLPADAPLSDAQRERLNQLLKD
jgi:cytochrome c-type biogenesis protein CcmH